MTEHRVVILGDAWIDEIRDPGGVRESVSGDAVDLANALLGHGLDLTVVASIGEDADGERIRTVLHDRGVRLVVVPAPEGTQRRSLVRDRSGAEVELRRGVSGFSETRRSLAAQAEADLIVDLRQGLPSTVAAERDEVLRALGLGGGVVAPDSGADATDATDAPGPAGAPAPASAEIAAAPGPAADTGRDHGAAPEEPITGAPPAVLLPAPIVAGTYRHAPVRLLPDPPVAHAPASDWHGLDARLARLAT